MGIPETVKVQLMKKAMNFALEEYGVVKIVPSGVRSKFENCFEYDEKENRVHFWFDVNTSGFTHSSVVTTLLR